MAEKGTLELVLLEISKLLEPLANAADGGFDGIVKLAKEAGFDFNQIFDGDVSADIGNFATTFGAFYNTYKDLVETREIDTSQIGDVIAKVPQLIDTISELDDLPIVSGAPAEFTKIGERLLNHLAIEYLTNHRTTLYCLLLIVGVIDDGNRDDQIYPRINYNLITQLFDDAGNIPLSVYGWGSSDFNIARLFIRLFGLFRVLGISAELRNTAPDEMMANTKKDIDLPYDQLRIPIYEIERDGARAELGISLIGLDSTATLQPGIGLTPFGVAELSETINLDDNWSIQIAISMDALVPWGVSLRPEGFDIGGLGSSVPPPTVNFRLGVEYGSSVDEATILIGNAGASRLEIGAVGLTAGLDIAEQNNLFFELPLKGLRLILSGGEGDGFLSTILPEDGINATFELTAGLSTEQGFYFQGSAALEINIPTHLSIGPIELQGLYVLVPLGGEGIPIEISSAISANLGPLVVSIERLGFITNINFPGAGGNLGPVDLGFEFKPPNGVGLAIDASVVKGGGYLYFDFDKEEYAGVLELDLNGIVSVKAIALITTKMPDGSKGFSLLMIITAEFGSPIQLGLGFTLSGVGGLLGLNRTMRLEVIATGVRDGGINSIMFPQNVIENAPRIISDLKKYFPVEEGVFLIGPMVKIGWGSPNLVTVSLGVIIEIDTNTSSVGGIAILGVLKVALPDEDDPVVVIQVNFMGAIEPDKKRLWFFASMYDSRVLFITLEGQMGLLVAWGEDSNFVVSVGGFHPAFNPPALPFGTINRISLSILNESYARIRVQAYFAVTSNSVQFGAAVELYFGVSAFNIDGHLGFDALFRFSPFYFIISISASLGVKVFGIGLFSVSMRGSLEGPTPWHVEGTGSISLLFFSIDVDFSHTWGNEAETILPPINVMPLLVGEYQKLENWQAVLPASNQLLVTLRSFEQGATDLILHPVGSLKISQRAVPLGMMIDKVGNQKPADANSFEVTVNTAGIDEKGDVEESFAVGQYFAKSDSELLNARSFEPMKGGVELAVAGEQYHAPVAVKRVVRYEEIIVDTYFKRSVKPLVNWFGTLFGLFLKGNAVSKSVLSHKQQKMLQPFAEKMEVGKPLYTVVRNSDNTAFDDKSINFTSQVKAQHFMKQQIAGDANLAKQLHVIPQAEMQRAA